MSNQQLHQFVNHVIAQNYIFADDVKRLRNEILTDGITSHFAADALLALDRTLESDEAWVHYLVPLIVDYAVWGLRPTGIVPADVANWLLTAFTTGKPTAAALGIIDGIVREAAEVDPSLLLFARRAGIGRGVIAA